MDVELIEIREHLKLHPPFSLIDVERLKTVADSVEVSYHRAGDTILSLGDPVSDLYFIRSGAVEIFRRDGTLYNRLGAGDLFGQHALMTARPARFPVRTLEDTLVYLIPGEVFRDLFDQEEAFADYVEVEDRSRLRRSASQQTGGSPLLVTRVRHLVHLKPIIVTVETAVGQAAKMMDEGKVSALLVCSSQIDDAEPERSISVVGILTENDLTRRVVAAGRDHQTPVGEVMSPDPVPVDADAFVFEAVLLMMRHNIHHLPVLDRQRPVGMINLADVISLETQNSLFVARSILARDSLAGLKTLLPEVQASFVRMVNEDANSHMIGSAMATIGRTFKQRLIEFAEAELGPPPVPYCLLALGSMARDEQVLLTDQDNALILDDQYEQRHHGEYFLTLANRICDGLAELGYPYCTGGIMATNPKWRLTLSQWCRQFDDWIDKPDAEALLHSSIFFDLDGVAGEVSMADQLQRRIATRASQAPRFLGCLAQNALNRTPPLGFFRDFVLEKSGRYQNSLNLKRRGTGPLGDVIRVHALAAGSRSQNSFRRLDDTVAAGFLTSGMATDLHDALEFIAIVRVRHQAADIEAGRGLNNNINPEDLSTLDRRSLKDAFKVLSDAQKFVKFRFRP